jgi:chromosome segregation ATPase
MARDWSEAFAGPALSDPVSALASSSAWCARLQAEIHLLRARIAELEQQVQDECDERNRFRGLWSALANRETYAALPDGLGEALRVAEDLQRDLGTAQVKLAELELENARLRLGAER